jgi:hypothetical protein
MYGAKNSNPKIELTFYSDQILSITYSFAFLGSEYEEEEMMEGLQMHF